MKEGLEFDNQQIRIITRQLAIVKDGERLAGRQKAAFYEKNLIPLMDQEEKIEAARQAANLEQRVRDAATASH
jgi:hypothetical protein